jgi:Flp pilus assembly protein TadG
MRKDNLKGERGSVLAMSAISMLSLLLIAGLAVDISHFYTAKAELQNVADASALAGASQLNSTSGGIRMAVQEATKALNKYDFKNSVSLSSADITFGKNLNGAYVSEASAIADPTGVRFVKVTIPPKPVGVAFAAVALGSTKNIGATATAGMSIGLTMNKFYTAYAFIEPAASPFVKGSILSLTAQAGTVNTPTSYRVLAGPDGEMITTGPIHAYGYIGSNYTAANLNAAGMCNSARIGTNTRFGDYTVHPGANPTDHPPDVVTQENITFDQYSNLTADCSGCSGVKNRRVITVPIAANTAYNTSTRAITSNDLAAFFIRKKVGADCRLEVEYIGKPVAVPVGTYSPGGNQMSDLSIPVLYK